MLQFLPILFCTRLLEVILWRIYYVMSCVRPQLGPDYFHPKWAVDSSYSWNVHYFQIQWHICHSVGIGIKNSSRNRVNAAMNPVSIVAGCSKQKKHYWHDGFYGIPKFCYLSNGDNQILPIFRGGAQIIPNYHYQKVSNCFMKAIEHI